MRWTNIAKFFNENGKTMTHATVIHCVKKYPLHKKHNKDLDKWERLFTWKSDLTYDEIDQIHYLENKVKNLKQKLEHPLVDLLKRIPEKRYDETYERLRNITRSYEWKYKDDKII